jgi:hypothetical protein
MCRALVLLKYVPAVLCGLLVVAWALNLAGEFAIGGLKGQNRAAQGKGRDSGHCPGYALQQTNPSP